MAKMRILVFGRNGQVARCLREAAGAGHEITALGRDTVDLLNEGAAGDAIARHKPDIVMNAAAYTAVDDAEKDETAAHRLNALAPGEMAAAAKIANAGFIHLSTDYVFDGKEQGLYTEDHPANPLNIYGRTKLDGENAVLGANPQSVIFRTSWVFSEFGSNFVKTMLQLSSERSALNIVGDQIGGPTAARDIATAMLAAAGKKYRGANGAGIYHFQGAPAVSWAGFAEKIFELAARPVVVNPILTDQYPTPAVRPLRTVLDCARIERDFGVAQPDWRSSLRAVIAGLDHPQ